MLLMMWNTYGSARVQGGRSLRTLFAVVVIVVGIGAMLYAWRDLRRVQAAQSWPVARGEIIESQVVRGRSVRQQRAVWEARIRYRYEARGREYTGNTIVIGGTLDTEDRQRAQDRVDRWPVGASVPVFYDPGNPADGCLEREAEGFWFVTGIGALFVAVGVGIYMGWLG